MTAHGIEQVLKTHVQTATEFCVACDWVPQELGGDVEAQHRRHLADTIRDYLLSEEVVERAARAVAARNAREWQDPHWHELPPVHIDEIRTDVRTALTTACEGEGEQ